MIQIQLLSYINEPFWTVNRGSNSTEHLENDFHDISNRKLVSTVVSKHPANTIKQPVPRGCVFSNKKKLITQREIMVDVVGDSIEEADEGKTERQSSME